MDPISYLHNTHLASDFEAIYDLGQVCGENAFHTYILSAHLISSGLKQDVIDMQGLMAASQYRENCEAIIPNFTDNPERFDRQFAAGYIVAFLSEQDAYLGNPQHYQPCGVPLLPMARIVDSSDHL